MSRWSRPSLSKRTGAMIALALLGVLGGCAAYRSGLGAPSQRAVLPAAGAPGRAAIPPGRTPASSAAPTGGTTRGPRAAAGSDASVTVSVPRPAGGPSGSADPSASVELRSAPERRGSFRIRGIRGARLAPGLSAPLDLLLTNPNGFSITVRSLTVRVRTITAPRADAGHPCSAQDFTVAQFAGRGLRLGPASKTSLGRSGLTPARWPRVSMLDRPINQDGCKGASLTLDYRGVARR